MLEPNPDAQKKYDAAFPVYQKLYRSLKEDLRAIATSADLPAKQKNAPRTRGAFDAARKEKAPPIQKRESAAL